MLGVVLLVSFEASTNNVTLDQYGSVVGAGLLFTVNGIVVDVGFVNPGPVFTVNDIVVIFGFINAGALSTVNGIMVVFGFINAGALSTVNGISVIGVASVRDARTPVIAPIIVRTSRKLVFPTDN